VRAPSPPSSSVYGYAPPVTSSGMPGSYSNGVTAPSYEVRAPEGMADRPAYHRSQASAGASQYPPPPNVPYPQDNNEWMSGNYYADLPPHERPGYVPPQAQFPSQPREDEDDLAYGDANISPLQSRHPSYGAPYPPQPQYPDRPGEIGSSNVRYTTQAVTRDSRTGSYSYKYAPQPDKITYTDKPAGVSRHSSYTQNAQQRPVEQLPRTYSDGRYDPRSQSATYVDIPPGANGRDRASSSSVHRLSVNSQQQPGLEPPRSPGLRPGMSRLSVGTGDSHMGVGGDMPPPSPLLEAYHGTYQSLPSPLALRPGVDDDDDLSDLEPLSPSISRSSRTNSKSGSKLERDVERSSKDKKKVTLYNAEAEEEAKKIAKALNHSKPDSYPIIDILPRLSHDQIWELRKEYKKQVKIQGKGINLPKHLKLKLNGNFGKVAYVTALGRWESEGYWANFWYQSHGSRRELLIESLMGRTNLEIRNIKDEFKDKRYSDSLTRCMEKELKMDKFRTAVLMALEERRQEENDVLPVEYQFHDVNKLHQALTARQGGESAILEIVVRRSDAHLREVLSVYEKQYGENFARAALRKSNNLVVSTEPTLPSHSLL
jgi:hypothetical protein